VITTETEPASPRQDVPKLYDRDMEELYENGKGRRYSLLFAVNGGAYTLAVFLLSLTQTIGRVPVDSVLLFILAVATMLFSWIMCDDVYEFGIKVQKLDLAVRKEPDPLKVLLFGEKGQQVLKSFRWLLTLAWLIAAAVSISTIFFGISLTTPPGADSTEGET
jgi:hypothetical protein